MTYERPGLRTMRGYTWGEQPQDSRTIKLNTNENPYPPSPQVQRALREFDVASLRRYPQPTADAFRDLVCEKHGVERDQVLATNGGDELLRLAFTTYLDAGDVYGTTEPSYSLYPVLAAIQGCREVTVPLRDDWSMADDIAAYFNTSNVKLLCLVNPHAPTGHLTATEQLARIAAEFRGVLLIDEAYVDFVDPNLHHHTVGLTREFDNVVLLRTLSKGYSLAGLRFGFAIGARNLIEPMLTKTRDSYNTDAVAQSLATAAYSDTEYARTTWERVRSERQRLSTALAARGFATPPSQTNFLLVTVPEAAGPAAELRTQLKTNGILVRHFDAPRLRDKLRITIGDSQQNDMLISVLDDIIAARNR